jgi:hypothetical protein
MVSEIKIPAELKMMKKRERIRIDPYNFMNRGLR